MSRPPLTIAVISCNRLHFLKALMESARECLDVDGIEWIVADNASIEEGLRDYLRGLDFIDHLILQEERVPSREFAISYNDILEKASGRFFLLLTDDVQFIFRGSLLRRVMEIADRNPEIGSIVLNAQRRSTIDHFFKPRGWRKWFQSSKDIKRFASADKEVELLSYGKSKPGIAPAIANCLVRTEVVKKIGPIFTEGKQTVKDAGGGFEAQVLARYAATGGNLERCLIRVPLMAMIITDDRGSQARIRGNRRYGHYFPPKDGAFFYRIKGQKAYQAINPDISACLEEIIEPLGYRLPLDTPGGLRKDPQGEGDAFEWVHPSVVEVDI